MNTYIVVTLGALVISIGATYVAIHVARALRLFDVPGVRKVHAVAIPRIGGAAIVVALFAMVLPVFTLENTIGQAFRAIEDKLVALLAAGVLIFLVGLVDDVQGLRPRAKLLAEVLGALVVCTSGTCITGITLPGWTVVDFGWLSWPITILWIVGVTNALNLIDGLDGLAGGIAAIACAAIAAIAILTKQPVMAILMLGLLGSIAGFLVFNFNPARVFMGDCGSLFLGFMLGASSVLSATKTATAVGLAIPLLSLGVPVFDMIFSMLRRMLERRSLLSPDRGHIHHRLLDRGISHRRAVIALYLVTLLVTGLAMCMMATRNNADILVVFACVVALLLGVFRLAGAVRLRASLVTFQQNIAIARDASQQKRNFEHSQLRHREATTFDEWWESMCAAAERLQFALLSLTITRRDGSERTLVWRQCATPPPDSRVLRVTFPVQDRRSGEPLCIEAHVGLNGSLEAAGRRGVLFGRLIDEHSIEHLPRRTR